MHRLRRNVLIAMSFVLTSVVSQNPAFADRLMIAVDKDVSLEVMDWGGAGRPVVLLAGVGGTAPMFGGFAVKLTPRYHVYGITRRGFGGSSSPPSGYSADRLGDDVLAVIDALKLDRPVLVGHSMAGEELSSIGSRHPEKVSGLVYLDAAYGYAYYDASRGDLTIDRNDLLQTLTNFQPWKNQLTETSVRDLLDEKIPKFQNDLRQVLSFLQEIPQSSVAPVSQYVPAAVAAMMAGEQKYSHLPVPILAIFADPHDLGDERLEKYDAVVTEAQVQAFERGVPSARVVRLPYASHNIFVSNEADVLREMDLFIGTLH
jgi:pimeloyl-ACP methyl ester carboxylesterase